MAELLVCLVCIVVGLCAGAVLGLCAGWLLGIRLFDYARADPRPSESTTTLAAKALLALGGLVGAAGATLLCLLLMADG
jgi:hypothetical protein